MTDYLNDADLSADDEDLHPEGQDDLADDAGAPGEGEDGQSRRRPTAKERIGEVTAARRAAERRADAAEAEIARLRGDKPAAKPAKAEEDKEPDPKDFDLGEQDPKFIKALTGHATRAAIREERETHQAHEAHRQVIDTFDGRLKTAFPDGPTAGFKAFTDQAPKGSPVVNDFVLRSDAGPLVADHLGANPDELKRISALAPLQQLHALARLEVKLAPDEGEADATPNKVSNAPEPPARRLGGGGGSPPRGPDDRSSINDWMKARNAQVR